MTTETTNTGETHVLLTGPITGSLVLADGTKIDVTPAEIVVASQAQVDELCDLIGRHWEANGHPEVEGDFVYDRPTEEA